MATYSACKSAKVSNLVFAGTVESVEPRFLSRWTALSRSADAAEVRRWETDTSPGALEKLKQAYLKLVPDLPERSRRSVAAATTQKAVTMAVFRALGEGVRVRFEVRTVFASHKDEEDEDGPADLKSVVVATDAGECGIDFVPGETYLVYAVGDEGGDRLETSRCTRTRRLTDAGEDLAYLFFLKNAGKEAARLEGFVTSDRREVDRDWGHDSPRIGSPVGAVLELKWAGAARYTESDANGRFVLDGLAEGDYLLSAFAPGYPGSSRQLAGPTGVHVKRNECVGFVLLAGPK